MTGLTVLLNGELREIAHGSTLADLIAVDGQPPQWLATAVNDVFVPRDARSVQQLHEGDAVFTFQPITGG